MEEKSCILSSNKNNIPNVKISDLRENFFSGDYNFLGVLEIKGLSKLGSIYPLTELIILKDKIENILLATYKNEYKFFKAIGDKYIFFTQYDITDLKDIFESFNVEEFGFLDFYIGLSEINTNDICSTIKAEIALSLAKKEKTSLYIFDQENKEVQKTMDYFSWKEKTKKIIANQDIIPYYQPIYNINTGKIEKYEVLARAIVEEQIISPFFFINHAEELGLINELTKIVIEKSFMYFKDKNQDFALSINLSEKDICDHEFITFIKNAIQRYNIRPERITLEILENITFSTENDIVISKIRELQKLGFKLAIDDFGSDNSNFSRLLNIDIDYIKFDAIFIKNINNNERNKVIVKSMVSMAKVLNIKTIAEYVETKEIMDTVIECGIDFAQGYYIGKPEAELVK